MQAPLIIGGGPAGAAAAATIAAAGHPVTVIERATDPTDKVCGDFLSSDALAALATLSVDPTALGGAAITTLRLVRRHKMAETALPFPAIGLTRRTLDEALLQRAAQFGADIRRGHAVRKIEPTTDGFAIHAAGLNMLPVRSVFVATGKHDLRGVTRPHHPAEPVGLKMYYALAPDQHDALRRCIELLLFTGGYAGLQLVEHGRAVLCLMVSADRFRRAGGHWDALLQSIAAESPHLQHRLRGATPCLQRPLAIAGIPYGHLYHAGPATPPGLFRLGDQACVIPSFAGDGVAIALTSGMLAARTWLDRGDATAYHQLLVNRVRGPLRLASLIHHCCVTPALQPLVAAASRAWPAAMRRVATATRIAPA